MSPRLPPARRQQILAAAALHLDNQRVVRGFRPGPGALDSMQGWLLERAAAAHQEGVCEVLEHRGRVRAMFLLGPEHGLVHGETASRCLVAMERHGRRPREWLAGALGAHSSSFDESFYMELDTGYHALLDPALASGLHIESLILMGRPRNALAGLSTHHRLYPDLSHLGLEVSPLASERQVDRVLELKQYFSRHPEFGWFSADEGFLKSEREEMVGELLGPEEDAYTIRRGSKVQGYYAFSLQPDHQYFGRVAHMDFILAPSLQGKGICTFAYRELLRAMLRRKVESFKGGTSQGAVLHLARSMRRPLLAWCLRHGSPSLPREHFAYPLG